MKNIIIAVIVAIVFAAGYYAISPLLSTVEVNDELPVAVTTENSEPVSRTVTGGTERLTPEELVEMEKQITEANKKEAKAMDDDMPKDGDTEDVSADALVQPVTHKIVDTLGHPAEGTVRVIDTADGQVIRFEGFKTINGPRLHLYLAKDLDGEDYIDLGPIRGTEGNINYTVPPSVDLSEYRYVMHWCVPFSVLFNYADLNG